MEAQGRMPDYDICQVIAPIRPLLESGKTSITLHPAEYPEGVKMDEWIQHVTARTRKAP